MEEDPKLTADEARRIRQREAARAHVERQVNAEVAEMADRRGAARAGEIDQIAAEMRDRAVVDVIETEHEIGRARVVARVGQIVDYLFYVAYALLGIRLLLGLLGANAASGFVQWVLAASEPLHAPFRGIFPTVAFEGGFTFALSVGFAIIMYAIAHGLLKALLRLIAHRRTAI